MKKNLFTLGIAAMLVACSSDGLVDKATSSVDKEGPIGFVMGQRNMSRATSLQSQKHYNFGVFAYKSSEQYNDIMANYLVGYMDATNKQGYYMTAANQTTLGDNNGEYSGKSMWAYEKMGSAEYNYTGGEGYYTKNDTPYMSNVPNQYLRFWDLSAPTTTFYAYSPYINGANTATYDNATHILSLPDGSIEAAYDNPTDNEYMYAAALIPAADYGNDVQLQFRRLNAKVNIKFWEDVDGYSARILDLKSGTGGIKGVQAAPAEYDGTTFNKGKYYAKSGANINFTNVNAPVPTQILSDGNLTGDPLVFEAPMDAEVGTTRMTASPSATTYYAVPKNNNTGFTFHVTYELKSTTGEKIVVKNATVHVGKDYANWAPNKHYTYIFKITRNTNGTTETDPTIDPTDPDVPTTQALIPIVFDNCTIEDWTEEESEHDITNGTNTLYYGVVLDKANVNPSSGNVDVTATLKSDGVDVTSPAGTWSCTGPTGYDTSKLVQDATNTNKFTVKTGATIGVYTVTYTPSASENAPAQKYTATFNVNSAYALELSTGEIGTGGTDATTLKVITKKNDAVEATASGTLAITYPAGLTEEQKNKVSIANGVVTVKNDAVPATYTIVFTPTEQGTATLTSDFVVKNYGLELSSSVIELTQSNQTINITEADGTVALVGTPAGISLSGNVITVTPDAAVGTHTVKRTVTKGTSENPSTTVYEKTFTVKNNYQLALSYNKSVIDLDDADADRTVTITAKKNAKAETDATNIEILDPNGNPMTGVTLSYVVPKTAVTGTYTVNYKDGTEIVKTATFIVQP